MEVVGLGFRGLGSLELGVSYRGLRILAFTTFGGL